MEDHLPDEDVLLLPDPWRRALHARRGGAPGPKIKVDAAAPGAVRDLVDGTGGAVDALLKGGAGDPALAEAARRHLDGEPDPAGAAAVAAVTVMGSGGPHWQDGAHRAFVDMWITGHGLAFAACALVELARTKAVREGGGTWRGTLVGAVHPAEESTVAVSPDEARRVRGLLAVASEPEHADAVARLAAHRTGWGVRWLVSYLVPSREDWVDECCAAPVPSTRRGHLAPLVFSALGKADQLAAPFPSRGLHWGQANRALLATLADGLGAGALPFLLGQADTGHLESQDRKRIYETIAVLPSDEAFQALLDRLDRKHVRAAFGEAARRFPVRALRLLARAGAGELLANHAEANAALVAAALPALPGDVAAAVERAAAAHARVPAAAAEELPAVLADPPWLRSRRSFVPGLRAPEPRLAWRDDAGLALVMAEWLAKGGKTLAPAREWFARHGLDAVPLLVPAALGKNAKEWRHAETALRHLRDARGLDGVVGAALRFHGRDAADAIGELLSAPPAETGLDQPAKTGAWVDPARLPQVLLRGGDRALPLEASRRLIELLTLETPHGMDELARVCEPGSIPEFGWALFQQWLDAGKPSKDVWALRQLGRTGDDETVRRLTRIVRAWPGEGGHRNAVHGLGVLAEIGSDVALMHLHGIAQKVKFKGLQAAAQERIREVADRLGLGTEQLADRLVPDFGLDADGSMVLDYGPRRFTVRFDEQLKPFVADEDGKHRKALPKPAAKDDPELAPAAYKAFAGLKKDVRTVASDQLRRLERAMVTRRRWTPAEFGEFIAGHPLVRHIARRLVWICEDGAGTTAFRIAEDRTFADAADDAFTLPEGARVGVAHPLHLDVAAWTEVFADYEMTQPFAQLTRRAHALTEDERGSGRLERFEKLEVPFGKVLGLVNRGWERGEPQDAGGERWISRRVGEDRYVVIDLDPGISVGAVDATGDHQVLDHVWFATAPGDYRPRKGTPLTFGELDAVTASEVLADLTTLEEAALR